MSRSVDDWVDDNIAQPLTGKLYSMADAIESLGADGFIVTGSSPQFFTDWRWYKRVFGDERQFNERAIDSYYENIVNFLDYRETLAPHEAAVGRRIRTATDALYEAMHADDAGDPTGLPAAIAHLKEIAPLVKPIAPSTAASLDALANALSGDAKTAAGTNAFSPHFGRGQQYLSFTRDH
jgi:HAMP domain-containing protein